jgi:hypothetical protein
MGRAAGRGTDGTTVALSPAVSWLAFDCPRLRPRLFKLLRRATLVVAPVAALGLAACCPDSLVDEIILLRDPDAATQALIDACRDPAHPDCVPLCRKVTGMAYVTFEHCEMHPDQDGYLQVHVGYHEGLGCE